MKRRILCVCLICLLLSGCGLQKTQEQIQASCITIKNDVPNQLKTIGVTYYEGDNALGSVGLQNADGSLLDRDGVAFRITEEDVPADLSDFRIKVTVTDARGASFDVCELAFIPEFGKDYTFLLRGGDGCYCLWSEADGNYVELSPAPVEDTTSADAFDEVADRYQTAVSEGWDASRMMENGLNYMIPGCLRQDERASVGYYKGDLNGDGQPELAIAAKSESEYYTGMIFALYELADGEPVLLVESGERSRWYYAGDGMLYNEGSSGAGESCCSLCTLDRELAYLDAVEYNAAEYPEDPWLRFTGETWEHIPEADANDTIREMKYRVRNLDIAAFHE